MVFVTHDQVEAMTMADRIVVLRSGTVQQVGTPEQVYERPANCFVASFIGSPAMNFMSVTLENGDARLEDGTTLEVGSAHEGPAVLGVRPEHLVPITEGQGIAAELILVEPLGSDTLVHFNVLGVRCIARVRPETRPQVGDRLVFGVQPGRAHLFDPDSGARLE